jgi:hypothetical protein
MRFCMNPYAHGGGYRWSDWNCKPPKPQIRFLRWNALKMYDFTWKEVGTREVIGFANYWTTNKDLKLEGIQNDDFTCMEVGINVKKSIPLLLVSKEKNYK